jgi:endonuclease/exonuclease/phosphatase family metal-dependent hydrolase
MKLACSLLGFLLLISACTTEGPQPDSSAPAPDQAVQPVALTVATFNVYNFFDAQDDPSHQDDTPSASSVTGKLQSLGRALRELNADVVALQEVENFKLLQRLNTEELSSLNYTEVKLVEGNDVRGIDVALLSRFKVTWIFSHASETFKGVDGDTQTYGFSRDCLEIEIKPLPNRPVTLLINHLRSSTAGGGLARRYAQAQQVRKIADGIFSKRPDGLLAVLGDLNDGPQTKTLSLVKSGTPALFDLLSLAPAAERYTFKNKTQLDYIIVSPALQGDLVAGSVKADHRGVFSGTSDHFPVIAKFMID